VEVADGGVRASEEAGRKSIKKWYAKVGEFDKIAYLQSVLVNPILYAFKLSDFDIVSQ
jgi:hypothetical protein